jgi:ferredoxin-NADP reductase
MSVLAKTKLTLTERSQETPDVTTFRFSTSEITSWKPGQYLRYALDHPFPDSRGIDRYFTIASAPFEGHIQITTRFAEQSSSFKTTLRGLRVGGTIEADGLEGDFVVDDPRQRLVFIAGGIGITPFRSILLALDHDSGQIDVDLLYANHSENFPFKDELERIAARQRGLRIRYFYGANRLDELAIRGDVGDLAEPVYYVSGPMPMVASFTELLKGMDIPEDRIKTDDFPGYAWP